MNRKQIGPSARGGKRKSHAIERARTCIVCRQIDEQKNLMRLAWQTGQNPVWDATRTAPGRGAYVHLRQQCVARINAGVLASVGKRKLSQQLDSIVVVQLKLEIGQWLQNRADDTKISTDFAKNVVDHRSEDASV